MHPVAKVGAWLVLHPIAALPCLNFGVMAFGSKFRGSSRDFGLTSNLTLPVATNVHPAGGFMPEEGRRNKRKTHARFTIDQVSEPAVKVGIMIYT